MSFLGGFFEDFFLSPNSGGIVDGTQYLATPFTSETSFSVEHNFGDYPIAQIIDNGGLVTNVFTLVNDSVNQVTVALNVSMSGTLLLVGGTGDSNNYLATVFTDESSIVIPHGFGRYPIVQVIDSAGDAITTFTAVNNSTDQVSLTFLSETSGMVILQA